MTTGPGAAPWCPRRTTGPTLLSFLFAFLCVSCGPPTFLPFLFASSLLLVWRGTGRPTDTCSRNRAARQRPRPRRGRAEQQRRERGAHGPGACGSPSYRPPAGRPQDRSAPVLQRHDTAGKWLQWTKIHQTAALVNRIKPGVLNATCKPRMQRAKSRDAFRKFMWLLDTLQSLGKY